MSLSMSCYFAGDIAPGVELMGMPMPTLIKSTLKTIESGCRNSMFWELSHSTASISLFRVWDS